MDSDKTNVPEQWRSVTSRRADAMKQDFERKGLHDSRAQQLWEINRQPAPERAVPERSGEGSEGVEWLRIFAILKKRWRLSAAFAVVVILSTAVVTFTMTPIFEPQARLEVDPPGAEIFSLQGNSNGQASIDYMETQAQNLQNDELTMEVIRKLRLDRSPFFGGDPRAIAMEPERLQANTTIPLTPAESRALLVFTQSRKIKRDAASRLITVSVAAPDPQLAAEVTNSLVKMFIDRDYKLRNNAISQSSAWLQRQLDDIHQNMDRSNLALSDFEKAHGIGMIGDTQSRFVEEMAELSRQTMQAEADRIQLESYLKQLNVPNRTLPQVSSSPVVQEFTKRLADVRAQIAETRVIYGGSHPNTRRLQSQADELQAELDKQSAQILRDLQASYSAAQSREHSMQSQLEGASKRMMVLAQYNALKKESDANAQLYQALYQKIKEAAIAAATKSSNIRIVDHARVLDEPSRPRRKQNMGAGVLLGLFGGVIVAFLREGFETRIRTPEDMKRVLGGGVVSVIPMLGRSRTIGQADTGKRSQTNLEPSKPYLFQIERPQSPEGEALRSIGVSLRLSRQTDRTPQVLMIASPLTGEGKTTVSVNLALTLAGHGRTCIVDADLRREGVAPALGVFAEYGIRDVLAGVMPLEEVLMPNVRVPELSLLAPGSQPGEPGELVSSDSMAKLVGSLRQRFDYVVIDSPPLLLFSDARALAVLADGIIMVGRAGVTTRANLKRAMELLGTVRSAPVVDLVLNAAEQPVGLYKEYRRYAS